jgi:hypothetical protein
MTTQTIFSHLKVLIETGNGYELELEFCSSHFFELDHSQLRSLPLEVLYSIISRESLRLMDEDSLYR